jgi:hypothetical protein
VGGEAPASVRRFTVNQEKRLSEDGRVDFAAQGVARADIATSDVISAHRAYLPLDVVGRVIWDPEALIVTGTKGPLPTLMRERDGLPVSKGWDSVRRNQRLFQPFYWRDPASGRVSPSSQIAVYDTMSDETGTLIDVPCPMLEVASQDEAGDLYFSSGAASASSPGTCVARVKAGAETLDAGFTLRFADVTGGHEGAELHYTGNGKGVFAVFDAGRKSGSAWRLWSLDLQARNAAPVDGVDDFDGYFTTFTDGRRTLLLIASSDFRSTIWYELRDGRGMRRFEMRSVVTQFFKVAP